MDWRHSSTAPEGVAPAVFRPGWSMVAVRPVEIGSHKQAVEKNQEAGYGIEKHLKMLGVVPVHGVFRRVFRSPENFSTASPGFLTSDRREGGAKAVDDAGGTERRPMQAYPAVCCEKRQAGTPWRFSRLRCRSRALVSNPGWK